MICAIGCDHAGKRLASEIYSYLLSIDIVDEVIDIMPDDSVSVDYPDFASLVCQNVISRDNCFGILVCGSGIGMSICANKIAGIRAALCVNEYMAKYSRLHNNANVVCLGERVVGYGIAKDIVHMFLTTQFDGGRHQTRLDKIDLLD